MQRIISDWIWLPSIDLPKWWQPELDGLWRNSVWIRVRLCVWICARAVVRLSTWVRGIASGWIRVKCLKKNWVKISPDIREGFWVCVRAAGFSSIGFLVGSFKSSGIQLRVRDWLVSQLIILSTQLWWQCLIFRYHLICLQQWFPEKSFQLEAPFLRPSLAINCKTFLSIFRNCSSIGLTLSLSALTFSLASVNFSLNFGQRLEE